MLLLKSFMLINNMIYSKNILFCFTAMVVKFNNSVEFLAITTESCCCVVWRSDFKCSLKCRSLQKKFIATLPILKLLIWQIELGHGV